MWMGLLLGTLCRFLAQGMWSRRANLRSRFVQTRVSAGAGTWDPSKENPSDPGCKKSPPLPKEGAEDSPVVSSRE